MKSIGYVRRGYRKFTGLAGRLGDRAQNWIGTKSALESKGAGAAGIAWTDTFV